ncbi:MAG: zinc ribbon domain-containing protein [Dethiobacteria bacterium]
MQLKLLWELQKIDLTIAALQKTIEEAPLKSGVEEASQNLESLKNDQSQQTESLKVDRKVLKELEMKIQKIVDDRKDLNDGLYSGKTTSAKELEQMQRKMDILAEEKKKYEDRLLVLMESVEEQEGALNALNDQINEIERLLKDKEEKLEQELSLYRSELSKMDNIRVGKTEGIEQKYLDRYTMLSEKYKGQALALVENDICGGCRVFISSAQRGHLYNPGALVYCENCGRLLIKSDETD